MNLNALAANIKPLDILRNPAISDAERDYFRYYNLNFEEKYDDVVHRFGHVESGRFNLVVHYFERRNAEKTCFIVHGYYDHSGLFSHLIDFCLKRSMSVVIFDLPGHGLSTGERASIASFDEYQAALETVLSCFRGATSTPWYAIGQSTGAAILMDFLLSNGKDTFTKVVLLAPLYRPVSWFAGSLWHALLYPLIKRVRRRFRANSNCPDFVEFLKNRDPLQSRYLSMTWVAALKAWLKYFDQLPATEFSPLIVQGKKDTTVDWRHNLPVIRKKFPNAKVFFLKEAFHQLANEREDIRAVLLSAIDLYFQER